MWLLLSFGNMLTLVGLRLIQKSFVTHNEINGFRLNWLVTMAGLPLFLGIIINDRTTIVHLSASFWLVTFAVVVGFYPIVGFLYYQVIKQNELSNVLPLFGLVPIFTLLAGQIVLQQSPTELGIAGILCISLSIYVLQLDGSSSWTVPFTNLKKFASARAVFIISLVTALAAIGDKFAIARSSTLIYFALNSLGAISVLVLADVYASRRVMLHSYLTLKKQIILQPGIIILMSALLISTQLLGFAALKAAPVASYAIGIRNLNLVVASSLALYILGERRSRYKLWSYGLSVLGVAMIAL